MRARVVDDVERVVPMHVVRKCAGGPVHIYNAKAWNPAPHRIIAARKVRASAGRVCLVGNEQHMTGEGLVCIVIDAMGRR